MVTYFQSGWANVFFSPFYLATQDWLWTNAIMIKPFSAETGNVLYSKFSFEIENLFLACIMWVKSFQNGLSKICERQPLKNLKWYGLVTSDKDCLLQILLGPFLNPLTYVFGAYFSGWEMVLNIQESMQYQR